MAGCGSCCAETKRIENARWRRAVWIALIVNTTMFGVEIFAGVTAHSAALKADALDFLGDSANYAISLGVAGMALAWRARAAMLKGATLLALGISGGVQIMRQAASELRSARAPHAQPILQGE